MIGGSSSGKEVLGQVLARLALPTGGSIKLDGKDFFQLPEYVLGARTAYVGQETYLFPLSVRDNLLFGLKIRPVAPAHLRRCDPRWCARRSGRKPSAPAIRRSIPMPTGSTTSWRAPPARPICCRAWSHALKQVELDEDIYSLGLRGTIDAALRPDLAEKILKARHVLHGRLQDPSYAGLVETVQRRPLQPQPVGGREPAVRHGGRQAVRRRQHRGRPLRAVGIDVDRPRPRAAAHGPRPSPRPWSSCSPACRPTIRCSSSTASSPPTSCPTFACCCNAWAARASKPCPTPTGRA